jgi:hypothetical protein
MELQSGTQQDHKRALTALQVLAGLQRLGVNSSARTLWQQRLDRGATLLVSAAAALFVLLCVLGLVHLQWPLPRAGSNVAITVGVASQALAIMGMLLQSIAGVVAVTSSYRNATAERLARCEHDFRNAARIAQLDRDGLSLADRWLEQEIKRVDYRMLVFFGGSDKLALFSLAGVAWAVWKELAARAPLPMDWPIVFGVAFFAGLVFGSMLSRRFVVEMTYQRDLIQLSMSTPAHGETRSEPTTAREAGATKTIGSANSNTPTSE